MKSQASLGIGDIRQVEGGIGCQRDRIVVEPPLILKITPRGANIQRVKSARKNVRIPDGLGGDGEADS